MSGSHQRATLVTELIQSFLSQPCVLRDDLVGAVSFVAQQHHLDPQQVTIDVVLFSSNHSMPLPSSPSFALSFVYGISLTAHVRNNFPLLRMRKQFLRDANERLEKLGLKISEIKVWSRGALNRQFRRASRISLRIH
jgi:hypothetical protein